jgi:hypothetical protein
MSATQQRHAHDGWYVFIAASMLAIFVVDPLSKAEAGATS